MLTFAILGALALFLLRKSTVLPGMALVGLFSMYAVEQWAQSQSMLFVQRGSLINLNMLEACHRRNIKRVFYSSSACMYPEHNQMDPNNPLCSEDSAYPANPDSEYGWEKLFSERLYLAFGRNYGMEVRVARYHNIFGPEGTWEGGREKAPAAFCRKVAETPDGGEIECWGDGSATRSFLYVDECVEGTMRLTRSDWEGPVNIGSEEMVSIKALAHLVMDVAGKKQSIRHIDGPIGVAGRNSDNRLIQEKLGWAPSEPLRDGIAKTYPWIEAQVRATYGNLPGSLDAEEENPLRAVESS